MTQAEWTRGTEKVIQCEVVNTEMEPSTGIGILYWNFVSLWLVVLCTIMTNIIKTETCTVYFVQKFVVCTIIILT